MLLTDDEVRDVIEDLQLYLDSVEQPEPSMYSLRVTFFEEEGYMGTDAECIKHYEKTNGGS